MSALPSFQQEQSYIDHPLLTGLSRERLEALVGPLRPREVAAGRLLSRPGRRGPAVHLVLAGLLRAYELTADGRESLVELIGPGGLDGFVDASGRQARCIQTLEDSVILSLTEEHLDGLSTDPLVAARLTHLLLGMLKYREDQLRLTAVREPARRLALLLLMLCDRFGRPVQGEILIDCRLTHQALADMVGFRRETVTHALHLLGRSNALHSASGRLLVRPSVLGRIGHSPGRPAWEGDAGTGTSAYL